MRKLILIFLLGVFVGVVFGVSGLRFLTPTVFVEGVVEYVLPNNTGASAALPEGFMLKSIIYIEDLVKEDVGKQKSFWGQLGSIPDSDYYRHYPKLFKIRKKA